LCQLLETALGFFVFFEQFREFGFDQVRLQGLGTMFEQDNSRLCGSGCCPLW
jgi:hypothetical protein